MTTEGASTGGASTGDASAALLAAQDALQAEADEVYAELGLAGTLGGLGEPVRVGSAALGLMVRRDLDVTVVCAALADGVLARVAALGAGLVGHPQVREVVLRDDTGRWNTDPDYPDGIYLGVSCRSAAGHDWTLDVWFVDEPQRQPDLAHLETLPPRLGTAERVAILQIKRDAAPVRGHDAYRAVLDDGVRTPAEFAQWRARR